MNNVNSISEVYQIDYECSYLCTYNYDDMNLQLSPCNWVCKLNNKLYLFIYRMTTSMYSYATKLLMNTTDTIYIITSIYL